MKAVTLQDYSDFRGKKKKSATDFSESDSDFEPVQMPSKKKRKKIESNTEGERIDLTVALDNNDNVASMIKNLQEVTTRLEIVEEELSGFSDKQEEVERVRRILSCVEEKNRSLERSLEDIKVGLSCIICKSIAKFPWLITNCCTVLMCKNCAERWLHLDNTCPHCRADITIDSCSQTSEIRALSEIATLLSAPASDDVYGSAN